MVPCPDMAQAVKASDITLQKACIAVQPTMTKASLQKCLVQLSESTYRMKGFVQLLEGRFFVDCTGADAPYALAGRGKRAHRFTCGKRHALAQSDTKCAGLVCPATFAGRLNLPRSAQRRKQYGRRTVNRAGRFLRCSANRRGACIGALPLRRHF